MPYINLLVFHDPYSGAIGQINITNLTMFRYVDLSASLLGEHLPFLMCKLESCALYDTSPNFERRFKKAFEVIQADNGIACASHPKHGEKGNRVLVGLLIEKVA